MKILYAVLAVIAVYLLGAFYSAGFDISLWTEGTRFVTLSSAVGVSFLVIMGLSHP